MLIIRMFSHEEQQPTFAISVPIGSFHPRLVDCLSSLRAQSVPLQVALMDASDDPRVRALADQFDDFLTYRFHGPDEGQSDAIASGWQQIEGDILGWLNADDVLLPGALATIAKAFQAESQPDIVYGHSVIVDDAGYFTSFHWGVSGDSDVSLRRNCYISQPSCLFRRDLYDRIGGLDRSLHYTMDWDLWVRFQEAGAKFQFIDEVFSSVLWTQDAKTGGFGAGRRKELRRIIQGEKSLSRRLKTQLGFALHHVLEYGLPKSVARTMRRLRSRPDITLFGLDWAGEVSKEARIPLFHYKKHPYTHACLFTDTPMQYAQASVDGVLLRHEQKKEGAILFELAAPLPANKLVELKVSSAQAASLFVRGLRLEGGCDNSVLT